MALEEAEEKIEVMYQRPQSACVVLVVVSESIRLTIMQPDMQHSSLPSSLISRLTHHKPRRDRCLQCLCNLRRIFTNTSPSIFDHLERITQAFLSSSSCIWWPASLICWLCSSRRSLPSWVLSTLWKDEIRYSW